MEELPDGLAHGKKKIFQVNLPEDEMYAIFEYYLEYGDQCVTVLRLVKEDGSLSGLYYIPVKALIPFADFFRKELENAKP